ncbi:MAG TPA: PilZ domain-containing protein [Steroidobacteraceae bacterium]|nr:PilZ domain-containing protein [Steroidobacteraceae bacterium]
MPESFLGDGLIFEESLPVIWTPGALADGLLLARLNTDNHQLLGAESSLDEVRVHEALKDESPALLHELQRLEYKVNILLRLTAELALRSSGLPAAERVRMSSRGLECYGEHPAVADATGLLSIYINSALPQPLKIPSVVAGVCVVDGARATQFRFVGLSDAMVDMLEKLIFRHHRRLIAGAKHAAS